MRRPPAGGLCIWCAEHVRQLEGESPFDSLMEVIVSRRREIVKSSCPPCRRRLQTAISCFGPKDAVVNVMVKRRDRRSRHVGIREMSANDPLMKHRKQE